MRVRIKSILAGYKEIQESKLRAIARGLYYQGMI